MLLDSHKKFHEMGPKEVGLKEVLYVQVARTTAHTGEQFIFNIPMYPDDSRESAQDRINFCLSIIQDRMEDENKAILEQQEKAQASAHAKQLIQRNQQTFVNKVKALEKRLKKKAITQAGFNEEREVLKKGLTEANAVLQAELEGMGEKFNPPLPEAEGLAVVTEE